MADSLKNTPKYSVGKNKPITISNESLYSAALALRAINNPLRKKIIDFVNANPGTPVKQIYASLKLEQSVVSSQLAILRKSNFLIGSRDGQSIKYSVNEDRFNQINELIQKF